MKVLDLKPEYTKSIPLKDFVRMSESARAGLKVRIVPPTLGKKGFGHVVVEQATPVYKYQRPGKAR